MKVSSITLQNVRSFAYSGKIEFSPTINVLVGKNNSGKSTILRGILGLQQRVLQAADTRLGSTSGNVTLEVIGFARLAPNASLQYQLQGGPLRQVGAPGAVGVNSSPNVEPNNLISPFLSKRKVLQFSESINEQNANSITGTFENIYSKIDRLNIPQYDGHSDYINNCQDILGFEIGTVVKHNGKVAGMFSKDYDVIPITSMGEGVVNALGLIVDLAAKQEKVFLIEELENDIHPAALKKLLALIVKSSGRHQFFVSTHSNIVLKCLGGVTGARVFNVESELTQDDGRFLFTSRVESCDNDESRREVLESLGYDLFDVELWDGWLFFEESSAEEIVREFLIPWFVPDLVNRIRTFSTASVSNMEVKFEDFNRLFVYLHLTLTYKNRAWVIVDAGAKEGEILNRMRSAYAASGWSADCFRQLERHNFEAYYPSKYDDIVNAIDGLPTKPERRLKKAELLNQVKEDCRAHPAELKAAFKESAAEVVAILKEISNGMIR